MDKSIERIARVLRTDKDTVGDLCKRMEELTGKRNVPQKIVEENDLLVEKSLTALGVKKGAFNFEVYQSLINKVKSNDATIFELFRQPRCIDFKGCKTLLNFAEELAGVGEGFFIKKEKAIELLKSKPPLNIMKALGYTEINELIEKEDIDQVFAGLRFGEEKEWLNEVFFAQYRDLTVDDFEYRRIRLEVLHGKWLAIAEQFLKKKYHNVSHLKELGVIFVIPLELRTPGETMRVFGLILHYLHEVSFYSKLFELYAKTPSNFAERVISCLRGDVLDEQMHSHVVSNWLIVQRYLAKDDEYDWRLFAPHVNPEALHWTKAEEDIARLNERFENLDLHFWHNLDFVGDFYRTESGVDTLVSFNLIDTVMSLVMEKDMIKYLYHHQEALWNKIFMEYVGGREEMERLTIENFMKGYIAF
ncbi:MAG: hypothetical protein NUV61_03770 [Candidatus Azambacteria bacterium]|nr:hypothetical protein [Candidatus Azambacteria bacterium]